MNYRKLIIATTILVVSGQIVAQPKQVDRKFEKENFASLQVTELKQEQNVLAAYKDLGKLGWLVKMVKDDRKTKLEQEFDEKGRLDFNKTFRFVNFTPRNTYVRFIKETFEKSGDNLLSEFGALEDVNKLIAKKIAKAKDVGVATKPVTFQKREGIELTQFDFVYGNDPDKRRAVGSRRKSLMLFFTPKGKELELTLVVAKILKDNFRTGVRNLELIIDTSPNDSTMDDVVILHRYNQKPTSVIVLGAVSNTSTNPHRVKFKQQFYTKILDHFFKLYSMVASYASKDDNDYNEQVIETLEGELGY